MVGIGRSTYLKDVDGFVKARILRQTENNRMPVSVSYMGAMSVQDAKVNPPPTGMEYKFGYRIAYINQVLIARKFANWLSLQLMPTHIHYNFVQFRDEPNDVFAIGMGGRVKLTNRIALTGEYYMVVPPDDRLRGTRNSLTLVLISKPAATSSSYCSPTPLVLQNAPLSDKLRADGIKAISTSASISPGSLP